MNSRQRARFIDSLVEDLGRLSADFEHFGYRLMDRFHPAKWDHRGTNIAGAPVKSTIDSIGVGVEDAAEYSGEKNYFADPDLKKLTNDIDHIVTTHPSVKRAWMLSNCLATGGEMTRVRNLVAKYPGITIDVLDARRIAEFIVDNLSDHVFTEKISSFLPFLSRLRSEWALSHQIPTVDGYVSRPGDEKDVKDALSARRVVVVAGISGLGKSALCGRVAEELEKQGDYELVLWQDAGQLTEVEQLRAVYVDAYGERENLLGYLKLRKCLLILDNLMVNDLPRKVIQASGPETRVLATSQVTPRADDVLPLREVDEATARTILERDHSRCPDDVFTAVYRSVGGHPLLLSILNTLVADEGGNWSVAKSFGTTEPHLLPDQRRQRICNRILEQHRESLSKELAFIAWCGAPLLDTALLRGVCSVPSEHILRQRHFLSAEAYGTVRVNDLVFASILEVNPCPAEKARDFTATLARLIEDLVDTEPANKLILLRVVRVHRDLIARLLGDATLNARTRAALRLAYAIARDSSTDLALLGDPVEEAQSLIGATSAGADAICVRSVIESVEATFSLTKLRQGDSAAIANHQGLLKAFEHLRQISRLSSELRWEVEFHAAKALFWSRDKAGAEAAFRKLLEADPDRAAARIQLGRLLADRAKGKPGSDSEAVIEQFEKIMAQDQSTVAITVALAAFGLLRGVASERAIPLIRHNLARLLKDLNNAIATRLEQPFEIVAQLGSLLWYHDGDLLDDIFNTVSGRSVPTADDAAIFSWAQAQKQYVKSKLDRGLSDEDARPLLKDAVATYEQMRRMSDWERVQFAECLLIADDPGRALIVLDGVKKDRSAHWHHRRAQAHLALGDSASARAAIDTAIAENKEDRYQSTFLYERWRIRREQKDKDAIMDLREAHRVCSAAKYKEQLQIELKQAEQSLIAATS